MTTKLKKFIELLSELSIEVYEELGGVTLTRKTFKKHWDMNFLKKLTT